MERLETVAKKPKEAIPESGEEEETLREVEPSGRMNLDRRMYGNR